MSEKWVGNTQGLSRIYLEGVADLESVPKSQFGVSRPDFSTRKSGNTEGPTIPRTPESGHTEEPTILRTCECGNTDGPTIN